MCVCAGNLKPCVAVFAFFFPLISAHVIASPICSSRLFCHPPLTVCLVYFQPPTFDFHKTKHWRTLTEKVFFFFPLSPPVSLLCYKNRSKVFCWYFITSRLLILAQVSLSSEEVLGKFSFFLLLLLLLLLLLGCAKKEISVMHLSIKPFTPTSCWDWKQGVRLFAGFFFFPPVF